MVIDKVWSTFCGTLSFTNVAGLLLLSIVLAHVIPYYQDPLGLRDYPGPFLAKFSDAWLAWIVAHGRWSDTVEKVHLKYGPFVRLSPTHISVADVAALGPVYGHTTKTTKSSFYDISGNVKARSLFSTRSREEHARKRRIEAHLFAPQSVRALEEISRPHASTLLSQWDRMCTFVQRAKDGKGPEQGSVGDIPWRVSAGRVWFDCMAWLNFWSFDNIGDLALGTPFGVLATAHDSLQVAKSLGAALAAITQAKENPSSDGILSFETTSIPVIATMTARAETLSCLGWLTPHWQAIIGRLPGFRKGAQAAPQLGGFTAAAVARRLAKPGGREDMLQRLVDGRDEDGRPMGAEELTAEAFTMIIAGADTTAVSACGIIYYLARDQHALAKLQAELDAALPDLAGSSPDEAVASFSAVERLPYLTAVINEGLRMHSTVGAGLPRTVPAGGITVLGREFKQGTCVSVPIWNLHRSEEYWGADVKVFKPERWIEIGNGRVHGQGLGGNVQGTSGPLQAFIPFSVGSRACIGRNLALMMLHVIIATLVRRYDFVLESPDQPLRVHDALVRKPYACKIGIKRREA